MSDVHRTVRIPGDVIARWFANPTAGAWTLSLPVVVSWPELQLTEEQMLAKAVALANGDPDPYPDHSLFSVEISRPAPDRSSSGE